MLLKDFTLTRLKDRNALGLSQRWIKSILALVRSNKMVGVERWGINLPPSAFFENLKLRYAKFWPQINTELFSTQIRSWPPLIQDNESTVPWQMELQTGEGGSSQSHRYQYTRISAPLSDEDDSSVKWLTIGTIKTSRTSVDTTLSSPFIFNSDTRLEISDISNTSLLRVTNAAREETSRLLFFFGNKKLMKLNNFYRPWTTGVVDIEKSSPSAGSTSLT